MIHVFFYQDKSVKLIEQRLTQDFSNLCDWFVDNKLSIHFGEDKTKSILFGSKHKIKSAEKLCVKYHDIEIKQHSNVSYLGCILNESLSGDPMALNVINKINSRLRFLYRNARILSPPLRRMLLNSLIQPHFDYAALSWFPNSKGKIKNKIQTAQNKCIRFYLELNAKAHIGFKQFKMINWLNTLDRYKQICCSSVFKYFNKKSPSFLSEIFIASHQGTISTRQSYLKLEQPFMKTSKGQNALSFQASKEWNKLPKEIKQAKNINTFKHKVKEFYFCQLEIKEQMGF